MRTLALDTSGPSLSVALMDGEILKGQILQNDSLPHSEALIPQIQRLLSDHQWTLNDLDLIGVSQGPGSFTGLRIAMATAKALAWDQKIPLRGVSTLAALAYPHLNPDEITLACLDARRSELYVAAYQGRDENGLPHCILAPQAIGVGGLEEILPSLGSPLNLIGSGVGAHPQLLEGKGRHSSSGPRRGLEAHWIGVLAQKMYIIQGTSPSSELRPTYLRPCSAKILKTRDE